MTLSTLGSNRDQLLDLAVAARDQLLRQQVLFGDPRRWRPRWFDGRFLAASDLQAEQNYFLIRQADLGRAGGRGVIAGLLVSAVTGAPDGGTEKLRIAPGAGVTDTGELAVLPEALLVDPADVPELQRLDAAFGLQVVPNESGRTRTGLYVLALRPVEWTANPVGAYPTSLTGPRTVEDATIVEGLAVSLIPYPDGSNDESWERRRARVAREIFVEGRDRGLDSGVLPLAMVALRGNLVEWVDPFLVRRETGAERPAGMDFGFGARALREAHLLQFQQHLADVLDANRDQPFAATTHFDALPPVGRFPAGTLNADTLTQRFFPAGLDVALSFVPEDELPALIEESLLLPPIDLTADADALEGTGVVVLVPLSRAGFTAKRSALPNWDASLPTLRTGFVRTKAFATPRDRLLGRQIFRNGSTPAPVVPAAADDEEPWRQLLRDALNQPLLWYLRRRNLPIPANVAGTPVGATDPGDADPRALSEIVRGDAAIKGSLDRLRGQDAPEISALLRRLAGRRFTKNPALLKSLLLRAAGGEDTPPPRPEEVLAMLAPLSDPKLGEGLAGIEGADAELGQTLRTDVLAETGALADVDKLARDVPADRFADFADELKTAARTPRTLPDRLAPLRRKFVNPTP